MVILGAPEIQQTPGVNLDDRLRMVPGFTLFRRSSSLAANPTTQGVSLRGLGSTGASRTLVLWDGVPLNDPFGGWVYWTRVSPEDIGQAEISRGASTAVFGDRAMGGGISLFSRPLEKRHFFAGLEGGNQAQWMPSAGYTDRWGKWGVNAQGRAFRTDGYFIVPESIRGRIDQKANVEFVAALARADYVSGQNRLGMKVDVLAEQRGNGTVIQTNSTSIGAVAANYARQFSQDAISLVGYHQRQEFRAGFSAIAANRNTETLTFRQSVPAEATGGAGWWRRPRANWNLLAGGDFQRVEGSSRDFLAAGGVRIGEGAIFQRGAFAQSDFRVKDVRLFLGARQQFTGLQRGGEFFSPSAGFAYGRRSWRTRGSVYRAYRAPTLNELYREFRAGNTVTQANAALEPEKVFGAEIGADYVGEKTRVGATLFRNDLEGIITNVTLRATPQLITRQRQNFGSALSRGLEIDARREWGRFRGEAAYLFVENRFAAGLRERVPQIPKHQGSMQLTWRGTRTMISAGLRSSGLQFEDDRNTQLLPGFATAQLMLRHEVGAHVSAMLAIENLLGREYLTGFTPAPQIGPPRLWRIGLRWEK